MTVNMKGVGYVDKGGKITPGKSKTRDISGRTTNLSFKDKGNTLGKITPTPAKDYSTISGPYDPTTGKLKEGETAPTVAPLTPEQPISPETPSSNSSLTYDQSLSNLKRDVKNPKELSLATDALKKRFNMAKETLGNQPAPDNAGDANSAFKGILGAPEADYTGITPILEGDEFMTSLMAKMTEFMDPDAQQESLVSEYQRMMQESGLEEIDAKLINADKIINGTEDDIRNEITKAGGFATDSQVLAMTNARNKSLIQNYNTLLQTKTSIESRLNTMMNLSVQDRNMASQKLSSQLNFGMQILQYRDKAVENARQSYANTASAIGWDGLFKTALASGDPQAVERINKTMGGGFNLKMASQKAIAAAYKAPSAPNIQKINGVDYQWDPTKGKWIQANIEGGTGQAGTTALAYGKSTIDEIDKLRSSNKGSSAVGPTGMFGRFRLGGVGAGKRQELIGSVEQLRSQLSLEALVNAKARGATFGALSEGEMRILSASATKLGSWAMTNKNGEITGYRTTQKNYKKELDKIASFAKLDYVLKGGDPTEVGVQVFDDGSYWVVNSDGTYTQIK